MVWTSKSKKIELKSITPHPPPAKPGIEGRGPSIKEINFTPEELFGAMARCSHLIPVDPDAVTFESEGSRYLIARHVDDQADDFFIQPSVKRLKDFSRTHLVGVVGAGIAYLQMVRDGYVWCDHFENLPRAEPAPSKKTPDFVFSRPGYADVAVTESKATHGSSRKQFGKRVTAGYIEQVSPYLGHKLGGATASHGFAIGSWMTSPTRAELLIDHTGLVVGRSSVSGDSGNPSSVKRGNYLTVLSLMFGPAVAAAARSGGWPSSDTVFVTTRWLDREWVVGVPSLFPDSMPWLDPNILPALGIAWRSGLLRSIFALELNVARTFFSALRSVDAASDALADLASMDSSLIGQGRAAGGAVYPDGFAVIGKDRELENTMTVNWDPQSGAMSECFARPDREIVRDPLPDEYMKLNTELYTGDRDGAEAEPLLLTQNVSL